MTSHLSNRIHALPQHALIKLLDKHAAVAYNSSDEQCIKSQQSNQSRTSPRQASIEPLVAQTAVLYNSNASNASKVVYQTAFMHRDNMHKYNCSRNRLLLPTTAAASNASKVTNQSEFTHCRDMHPGTYTD